MKRAGEEGITEVVVRHYSVHRLRVDLEKDGGEHRDKWGPPSSCVFFDSSVYF